MKFAKQYVDHIQKKQPEWSENFLSYNELKRLLRLISDDGNIADTQFLSFLNNEIDKFNDFFIVKEEDFVIRHKELQHKMKEAVDLWGPNGSQPSETDYKETTNKLVKHIVKLHGEMVLLINYCYINYTGLAKILKKYERRTGRVRNMQLFWKVFEHPFLTTNLISKLVRECESIIDEVFKAGEEVERPNLEAVLDEGLFRNTVEGLFGIVAEEGEASEPQTQEEFQS